MLIQELYSHTRVYPFEPERGENESDEQLQARLFLKPHFEVFSLPSNGFVGCIAFKLQAPETTLSQENAIKWVEKFNMIGSELKEIRKQLGITQKDLANQLDVKENTVYRWEADKIQIPKTVELAVKYLIITPKAECPK